MGPYGDIPKGSGIWVLLRMPAHCVSLGKKREKGTRETGEELVVFNTRATTGEGNGREGDWEQREKELKGSTQKSTQRGQLSPKHGQREQEGKGGEEIQEKNIKTGQGQEPGPGVKDPRDHVAQKLRRAQALEPSILV